MALQGVEHGFAVLAAAQSQGRGRLGRKWSSPSGCGLYCSIVLRPQIPFDKLPTISLTAGLSICKAVEDLGGPGRFGLKWPNDLFGGNKKCGGILVESSASCGENNDNFLIIGIGLNVNNTSEDFPDEIRHRVSSLRIENGVSYDIRDIFLKVRYSLLSHVKKHEISGFTPILNEWRRRDILYGQEMKWLTSKKKVITGVGLGPDENGLLMVKDISGNVHEILSGDVSLAAKQ